MYLSFINKLLDFNKYTNVKNYYLSNLCLYQLNITYLYMLEKLSLTIYIFLQTHFDLYLNFKREKIIKTNKLLNLNLNQNKT